jgi:hypothetical protein
MLKSRKAENLKSISAFQNFRIWRRQRLKLSAFPRFDFIKVCVRPIAFLTEQNRDSSDPRF